MSGTGARARPFAGRVALVTGGGTGIGAAISSLLAERGASVVICQPDQPMADRLAAELSRDGAPIAGIGADLARATECARLVATCVAEHGRVDVLVNCAAVVGRAALGDLLAFDDDQLDAIVDVNLKGAFRCSREVARHLVERGSSDGVIVNIASVGAFAAQDRASAYVASKAGIVGMTRGMAFELAPHGIRVVAVAPGDVELSQTSTAVGDEDPYDVLPAEWWSRRAPLRRRGSPLDIARAVAFVASDEASYVTGETIVVDGGWLSY
ncbi:SDR family NAD(P)-dependent oxidoreductase [Conexibacter sp. CPCC 206217]|uniref:SDR family NAD(P)-dependent oxidoreductase n=1 Tax=Conexibacter sp. CPCC 206217 TaxID=3064574 RepID=UPI00271A6C41|nr:SDR family oxidoreductase [Conexibacter sp. CPCC 206217]MDO8210319.1 SDR family oxidoreductase [Conexibacter sp. CPCC 206217]